MPLDGAAHANNLKASVYFLDACMAGVCTLGAGDGAGMPAGHTHAFVYRVEFGRESHACDPGETSTAGANITRPDMRATELAVVLAGYVRSRLPRFWARGFLISSSDQRDKDIGHYVFWRPSAVFVVVRCAWLGRGGGAVQLGSIWTSRLRLMAKAL